MNLEENLMSQQQLPEPNPQSRLGLAQAWQSAPHRYEAATGIRFELNTTLPNVETLLQEIVSRKEQFQAFRHDGSMADKLRGLLGSSMRQAEKPGEVVTAGTKFVRSCY